EPGRPAHISQSPTGHGKSFRKPINSGDPAFHIFKASYAYVTAFKVYIFINFVRYNQTIWMLVEDCGYSINFIRCPDGTGRVTRARKNKKLGFVTECFLYLLR